MALMALFAGSSSAAGARQYFELRVYYTQNEEQRTLINDYWQNAAIAAWNRAGVKGPIGVFTELENTPTNKVYVLIPYENLQAFEKVGDELLRDEVYKTQSSSFMSREKTNAPYSRIDRSLLHAMTGQPTIKLPPSSADKSPWIFELRTYYSPTEEKGLNKIEMFNAGEIQIMQDIGLNPVFFAGTILGPQTPSLIYMTSGPEMAKYKDTWKGFGPHPVWKKLQADQKYKNNMSGSQSVFLKRMPASQI